MNTVSALLSGAAIGLSVGAPIGPMGLLCIRRTLHGGIGAGLSTGIGASTVQIAYGAAILIELQRAGPWLDGNRSALTLVGGVLMLLFAARVLALRPVGPSGRSGAASLLRHYGTAVLLNSVNPVLPVLLIGAMGALFGPSSPAAGQIVAVLVGMALGSLAWWAGLSATTSVLGVRLSLARLRTVNKASAIGMGAFGAVALIRALGITAR